MGHHVTEQEFEEISSYSYEVEKKKKPRRNALRIVLKSVAGLLCVLLILGGVGMMYVSTDLLSELSSISITKDKEKLGIRPDATTDDNITNVVLFGLDSRDGSFQNALSDAIIVLSIDNKHNKIKMTSILRDTPVPDINGERRKINEAYYYGGPEMAIKTINENFGLNIEDFVTINFNKLAEVVDAFGGTRVTLDSEEVYYANRNMEALMYEQIHDGYERTIWESDYLPEDEYGNGIAGTYLLSGNQAVGYARIREDSDKGRADRQKKVLIGLIDQLMSMPASEYYGMAQQIFKKCQTSFDFGDVLPLLPILSGSFDVETLNIPSEEEAPLGDDFGDGLGWVWLYDLELAAQHIDRFIYEKESPYYSEELGTGADTLLASLSEEELAQLHMEQAAQTS